MLAWVIVIALMPRAKLADNEPVELQFTRNWDPPTGTPVVDAPGEP
ncbi:hypothetical protein [Actinomadura terrae]|nr:hypothetical protein [Actinomadura terrae]